MPWLSRVVWLAESATNPKGAITLVQHPYVVVKFDANFYYCVSGTSQLATATNLAVFKTIANYHKCVGRNPFFKATTYFLANDVYQFAKSDQRFATAPVKYLDDWDFCKVLDTILASNQLSPKKKKRIPSCHRHFVIDLNQSLPTEPTIANRLGNLGRALGDAYIRVLVFVTKRGGLSSPVPTIN